VSVLDQPDRWPAIDPKSMRSLLEAFPDQVKSAAAGIHGLSFQPGREPRNLVITGLGGSAIGGDIARSVLGQSLAVPLVVNRDYRLPHFVNSSSIVIACSYSGNTEETLSAYQDARRAQAFLVCIASGGRLAEIARHDGVPIVSIPGGLPPRAAFGYSSLAVLGCIQALGLVPDQTPSVEETCSLMASLLQRYSPAVPEVDNPAKRLARSLHGKIVAVYGSNSVLDAAATRWRGQMEENAKNLALHHVLPEMNHNELVGWLNPAHVLLNVAAVFLRDKGDHPQVQRRFDLTREVIEKKAGVVHDVWSEGNSLLARVFSIVYLGDFVSLYLAYLNGVDPMPVEVIESFKRKLSAAGA
jgi:glucose/mannose-6-phosphate isomerase